MSKSLPARPNLEQLKKQAKDLLKSWRTQNPESCQRFRQSHPDFEKVSESDLSKSKFTLSQAQTVIAREYGFTSWPRLKESVESATQSFADPLDLLRQAVQENDAPLVRRLFERHPALRARINEPLAAFDSPFVTCAGSRPMLDALLEAGADINARSHWWAGGFGLLDRVDPELAAYAIERGARLDIHAAARLGKLDKLREMLAANPSLVHARGGDGKTPLHFAANVEVAEFLLSRGAEMNVRDVDHESTPAQHLIRDHPEVAAFLVSRGCQADLLMAAALGDEALARRILDQDPNSIRLRVSKEFFPMVGPKAGGTIYQWTLGWYVSAHDLAKQFGHQRVLALLMERSPADLQLAVGGWNADERAVKKLLKKDPDLVSRLSPFDQSLLAHAARNNNLAGVRVMLAAGWPVDATSQHGATALHWAGFHGNAEMTREILQHNPPLERTDDDYHGPPLGWAIHGSQNGWDRRRSDYPATVEHLLAAGATAPTSPNPGGSPAVNEVLRLYNEKALKPK